MTRANDDEHADGRTHVSVREARAQIADLLNRAAYGVERIVVERHGKPIAAIVCVEDLEYLERADRALDGQMLAETGHVPSSPGPQGIPRSRRR